MSVSIQDFGKSTSGQTVKLADAEKRFYRGAAAEPTPPLSIASS